MSRLPLQLLQSSVTLFKGFSFSLFLDAAILHICPRDSPVQLQVMANSTKCVRRWTSAEMRSLHSSKYFMSLCHVSPLLLHFLRYESKIYTAFPGKPCAVLCRNSHSSRTFGKHSELPQIFTVSYGQRSLQPPTCLLYSLDVSKWPSISRVSISSFLVAIFVFKYFSFYFSFSLCISCSGFTIFCLFPMPFLPWCCQYIISFLSRCISHRKIFSLPCLRNFNATWNCWNGL